MNKQNNHQLVYYQFETFPDSGQLRHGIFTRLGGVSSQPYTSLNVGSTVGDHPGRVIENRKRIAAAMGVRDKQTVTTWQVHRADVLISDGREAEIWPPVKADAVVTDRPYVPLVMRYADCVPILLFDPVKQVLGLAHAGWRGTVLDVGPTTVQTMVEHFGCDARDIMAGIGPSIGPCHYEVGPEVVEQVVESFGADEGLIHPSTEPGHNPHFDLWEANRRALYKAGIKQIEVAELCTACRTDEFFSHRAEKGQTGRFAVMAVMGAT